MNSRSSSLLWVSVAGGLAQIAAGVAMYVAGVYFAPWSMAVSVAVLFVAIVLGMRRIGTGQGGGPFSYRDALLAGVAISVATGVLYALYNVVTINVVYPHFLDDAARSRMAMRAARHMPTLSFEQERATLTAGGVALGNLLRLSVIGSVFSALAALVMRRKRSE